MSTDPAGSPGVFGRAAAQAGVTAPPEQSASGTRPNILLIMADQLAAPFLPMYGHPIVKTPALERLAARGAVFESAYTNSPLCAPARFSMMSGQLASQIGAYDNAAEFASTVPTFAHYLRAGGYRTVLAGKMHFVGADQLHGFEERTTTDIYPADFGWTPDWSRPDDRIDWWFHNLESVMTAGVADVTNQLDFDDEVGFTAQRKLRDFARPGDDRPWMLTASFTHPHDPYVTRQRFWDLYDHDSIDMPRVGVPTGDALDPHSARLLAVSNTDAATVTDDQIRNARHAYYGSISYIDWWVGQLLDPLDATGMADNTVVIFTADHGDMLGERGLWYKMSFFENSCRVPMIISAPDRFGNGVSIPDHTSLVDLLPTLTDLAGAPIPEALAEDLSGDSLVPTLEGQRDPNRTIVGEYLAEGALAPIFMIRRGAMKYVWSEPDPPQLYDLQDDPDELTNLADNPNWTHIAKEFRQEITHRWHSAAIHEDIVASQQSRQLVNAAMRSGAPTSWDWQPSVDARETYVRNHHDLTRLDADRRL